MATLSSKELSALEDLLNHEDVLVRKYQTMANQCNDPAIKQQMEGIAQKHQGHYNKLTGYLK